VGAGSTGVRFSPYQDDDRRESLLLPLNHRIVHPETVGELERYQLITSLVVPRPIGWISTFGPDRTPNLAPFSFFSAVSATPMLVSVSVGARKGDFKDTLVNIRRGGEFCANVVTEVHLNAMNQTSAEVGPGVDEFALAGLAMETASVVNAPYVADCPAVLECRCIQEVAIGDAGGLFIGEVVAIHVDRALDVIEGTSYVDPESLRPIGRLWGAAYTLLGEIKVVPRPK
jgi:flavin reductase (DIM6/NTAB) family NADH-FMN oxidoreductase RutF